MGTVQVTYQYTQKYISKRLFSLPESRSKIFQPKEFFLQSLNIFRIIKRRCKIYQIIYPSYTNRLVYASKLLHFLQASRSNTPPTAFSYLWHEYLCGKFHQSRWSRFREKIIDVHSRRRTFLQISLLWVFILSKRCSKRFQRFFNLWVF